MVGVRTGRGEKLWGSNSRRVSSQCQSTLDVQVIRFEKLESGHLHQVRNVTKSVICEKLKIVRNNRMPLIRSVFI